MAPNDIPKRAESADAHDSEIPAVAKASVKDKKPRSKLEQRIVRGGILILFIVMLLELFASRGFNSDFAAAHDALGSGPVTESDIKRMITHYSSVESNPDLTANLLVATREDKYSYRGLLKKRVMYVYYGVVLKSEKEADVLDVKLEPTEFFDLKKMASEIAKPVAEEPAVTESAAVAPTAAEPTAVEPTAVEPTAVEPTAVEPTAVEPTAVEPTAVEPTAVEPTAVEPTAVEPENRSEPGGSTSP